MFSFQIFKPIDWTTASLEIYEGGALVAEVFARDGSNRRLYLADDAVERGLDWNHLLAAAPTITAMLDKADAEMEQVRSVYPEQ